MKKLRWTQEEDDAIKQCIKKGLSARDIFDAKILPHRTFPALRCRCTDLFIFDPKLEKSIQRKVNYEALKTLEDELCPSEERSGSPTSTKVVSLG